MPPRKKPKLTEASETENGQTASNTPASGDSTAKQDMDYDLVADPWTDEQETALLKAIIKWKPVGIHKHFRMIAISEFMKSQGYAPSNAEHTRIPGIWKKLGTLYNLSALDEREDSLITDAVDDSDPPNERYCPFQLPQEYGDMMFERRLATDGSESPTSARAESRRGSMVADTDEAHSPAPSRGRKSNRGGRQATRGTRSKRLRAERDGSRKDTATGDEGGDSDDSGENDEADEDGSDAAKEDSEIEDDGEEESGGSPTTRSTRAQTSTRSKQKEKGAGVGIRRTGRRR